MLRRFEGPHGLWEFSVFIRRSGVAAQLAKEPHGAGGSIAAERDGGAVVATLDAFVFGIAPVEVHAVEIRSGDQPGGEVELLKTAGIDERFFVAEASLPAELVTVDREGFTIEVIELEHHGTCSY